MKSQSGKWSKLDAQFGPSFRKDFAQNLYETPQKRHFRSLFLVVSELFFTVRMPLNPVAPPLRSRNDELLNPEFPPYPWPHLATTQVNYQGRYKHNNFKVTSILRPRGLTEKTRSNLELTGIIHLNPNFSSPPSTQICWNPAIFDHY